MTPAESREWAQVMNSPVVRAKPHVWRIALMDTLQAGAVLSADQQQVVTAAREWLVTSSQSHPVAVHSDVDEVRSDALASGGNVRSRVTSTEMIAMGVEITLGMQWGDPRSTAVLDDEHKVAWDQLKVEIDEMMAAGMMPDFPSN